jgi:type I restriction enzyme S subunit
MVNLKKIPEGFKETEVGIIPNDWRVLAINDVSEVRSGKRLPLGKSLTDKETDHFYIRVADMSMGSVSLNDIKYLPNDVYPSIKNYCIFNDDIFISVAGTLGLVGKIPPILNGANLTENADRLTNISCVRDYLLYVLMSWLIQNKIEAEKTLGAQPKLALARIRKFQIPLPPQKPSRPP